MTLELNLNGLLVFNRCRVQMNGLLPGGFLQRKYIGHGLLKTVLGKFDAIVATMRTLKNGGDLKGNPMLRFGF